MFRKSVIVALGFLGLLLAGTAAGPAPASAHYACGPWNGWCGRAYWFYPGGGYGWYGYNHRNWDRYGHHDWDNGWDNDRDNGWDGDWHKGKHGHNQKHWKDYD